MDCERLEEITLWALVFKNGLYAHTHPVAHIWDQCAKCTPCAQVRDPFVLNCLEEGKFLGPMKWFLKRFPAGADRFEGVDWFPAANGSPVLKEAIAYLECKVGAGQGTQSKRGHLSSLLCAMLVCYHCVSPARTRLPFTLVSTPPSQSEGRVPRGCGRRW